MLPEKPDCLIVKSLSGPLTDSLQLTVIYKAQEYLHPGMTPIDNRQKKNVQGLAPFTPCMSPTYIQGPLCPVLPLLFLLTQKKM